MFRKYPSIENHYHTKDIRKWLSYHPELADEMYVIQEKLHGANIQLVFNGEGELSLYSRKQLIDEANSFNGVRDVVEKMYYAGLDMVAAFAKETGKVVRLYGEFFGGNIQKGVDYGKEKRIRFFDIEIDGEWYSYADFLSFMKSYGLEGMMVPVLGIVNTLDEALAFDTERNTESFIPTERIVKGEVVTDAPPDENFIEGVVIKPIRKAYVTPQGSVFYLKKKNIQFKEKQSKPRVVKDPTEGMPEAILKAREDFLGYIHDERLQSVFSKDGEIQSVTEVGKYIKLVTEDARETFFKEEDFDPSGFDKRQLGYVFNSGKIIAELLMKYL